MFASFLLLPSEFFKHAHVIGTGISPLKEYVTQFILFPIPLGCGLDREKRIPRTGIQSHRTCRLLADLFTDSGGKRRKKAENRVQKRLSCLFSTPEPSWQSGGHEFDPRQLHQQNKSLTRFLKIHFSPSKANICRLFADFVSRIDVCDPPNHRHSLLRIARLSGMCLFKKLWPVG